MISPTASWRFKHTLTYIETSRRKAITILTTMRVVAKRVTEKDHTQATRQTCTPSIWTFLLRQQTCGTSATSTTTCKPSRQSSLRFLASSGSSHQCSAWSSTLPRSTSTWACRNLHSTATLLKVDSTQVSGSNTSWASSCKIPPSSSTHQSTALSPKLEDSDCH